MKSKKGVYLQNGKPFFLTEKEAGILNQAGYNLTPTNETVEVEETAEPIVSGGSLSKKDKPNQLVTE